MKKLIISCKEATTICTKNQYNEASVYEKIQLKIHLVICYYCRIFSIQNFLISQLLNQVKKNQQKVQFTPAEKQQLQQQINQEIKH